jgi:hypothetical protein
VPVPPDSRFASLPILEVTAPDGSRRRVLALPLDRPHLPIAGRHRLSQDEPLDLLAQQLLGSERLWWRLLDANPLVYPLDLRPGDILDVPEPGPATRVTRARSF